MADLEHWRYLCALDNDFSNLARYIEPEQGNENTYSLEIARLLMATTQECDVILKQLCDSFGLPNCSNENKYRTSLPTKIPRIVSFVILFIRSRHHHPITPFQSWGNNKTPEWWTANNKVKHNRHSHFHEANLKNLLDALAGLYLLNLILYRSYFEVSGPAMLFADIENFEIDLPPYGGVVKRHKMYDIPLN